MQIEKSLSVPIRADDLFHSISSPEYVAGAIPGAEITGRNGNVYEGNLTVKVGPITVRYAGTVTLLEVDQGLRRLDLRAQGKDQGNKGGVDANVTATVAAEGEADSRLEVSADIRLRGLAAQFGRGAVDGIVDALIDEFATNLVGGAGRTDGAAAGHPERGATVPRAISSDTDRTALLDAAADGEALNALKLVRGLIRPELRALLIGVFGGAVLGALIGRRQRKPRHACVTHADLINILWSNDRGFPLGRAAVTNQRGLGMDRAPLRP